MGRCTLCGGNAGLMFSMCPTCIEESNNRQPGDGQDEARTKTERRLAAIVLTTAHSLEGHRIVKTIEVITAECVFGINLFRDFFASVTNVFGGRSESSQKILRDARQKCLLELRQEALRLEANAVIAIDLDYSEISGGGKSMLFLVACGTAVIVEPLQSTV